MTQKSLTKKELKQLDMISWSCIGFSSISTIILFCLAIFVAIPSFQNF